MLRLPSADCPDHSQSSRIALTSKRLVGLDLELGGLLPILIRNNLLHIHLLLELSVRADYESASLQV